MSNPLHKSWASPSSQNLKKIAGSEDYDKQRNTFDTYNPNSYTRLNSSYQTAIEPKTGSSGSKKPRSEKSNKNRTAWYSSDEEPNRGSNTTSRLEPSGNYTEWRESDNSGSDPPYTESPSKGRHSKLKPNRNYTAWRGSIDSELYNSESYYSESYYSESYNSEYSKGESYNSGPKSSEPKSIESEIDDPAKAFDKLGNKNPQEDDHYTERNRKVFESLLPRHIYEPYNKRRLRIDLE